MCRNFWQLRRLIVLVALAACNNADETNPAEVGFDIDISGHDGYELGMSSRAAADVKLDYQYQPCGEHAGCYVSPTLYLQHPALLQVVEDTRRRQVRQIRLYFDPQLATDCAAMLNVSAQPTTLYLFSPQFNYPSSPNFKEKPHENHSKTPGLARPPKALSRLGFEHVRLRKSSLT